MVIQIILGEPAGNQFSSVDSLCVSETELL